MKSKDINFTVKKGAKGNKVDFVKKKSKKEGEIKN
jgi:hypothetical protein